MTKENEIEIVTLKKCTMILCKSCRSLLDIVSAAELETKNIEDFVLESQEAHFCLGEKVKKCDAKCSECGSVCLLDADHSEPHCCMFYHQW